ncbi:hypothetical protein ACJJTC_005428 [Scirpophaga incertulas]
MGSGDIIIEGGKKNLHSKIAKFLFDYRNSKNSTTDTSPAELVFGRSLRSRLDLLDPVKPSSSSTALMQTINPIKGIIKKKIGEVIYLVYIPQLKCEVKRHIDQIRTRLLSPPIDTGRGNWDPDTVPDVSPPQDSAASGTADSGVAAQPPQGESSDRGQMRQEASEVAPTTPMSIPTRRRKAISPIFSTPTSSDNNEYIS